MSTTLERIHKSSPKAVNNHLQQKKTQDVEYQRLTKCLVELKKQGNKLESKREYLQNTVSDLKKIIKKIGSQSIQELKQQKQRNQSLEQYRASLSADLICCYKDGEFMQKIAQFWKQYV